MTLTVQHLLQKPVWQMTGEDLLTLIGGADENEGCNSTKGNDANGQRYEYGIAGIAKIFGCSVPTANRIKRSGIIDKAITQVGRKIVVDVDLALTLAANGKSNSHGRIR